MRSMMRNVALMGLFAGLCEAVPANGQGSGTPSGKTKEAPSVEKVKMEDGREVEFVGKRKLLKESLFEDGQNPAVRLDFRNGRTIKFVIPDTLLARFAAHGAEQKLGDETAGEDDIDDAVLAVEELVGRLNQGEFNMKREGGGMSGTSVLLKAIMEYGKKTVEEAKAFLKDKTPAEKTALRQSAKLKPIVDRIEAEKAAKAAKIDTDALLAGLG